MGCKSQILSKPWRDTVHRGATDEYKAYKRRTIDKRERQVLMCVEEKKERASFIGAKIIGYL